MGRSDPQTRRGGDRQSCAHDGCGFALGGEEFLILMPLTSAQVAETVADKILSRIRNWAGQTGDKPITVTATLAVSEIRPAEDFESALLRADQALYKGKQQGRDQVILAS
ncbi:diguanylate cyclase [Erwinia aphidicola]